MAFTELQSLRPSHQDADQFTARANRRAFDTHLQREWGGALRTGVDSFVVCIEIDGFDGVDDMQQDAVRPDVLREFAMALLSATRANDIWGPVGGARFGVLLIRSDERAVLEFSARLQEAIAEQMGPRPGSIRVSLGHASLLDSTSPANALENAGQAMLVISGQPGAPSVEQVRPAYGR